MPDNPFRELPSVGSLVRSMGDNGGSRLDEVHLTRLAQTELATARGLIRRGESVSCDAVVAGAVAAARSFETIRLVPLINATGVIVHTNLGRSPVSNETTAAMAAAAASYVPLEVEPDLNVRGGRMDEVSKLMQLITGAERTLVVNNNAAAVLLTLSALAAGKKVIVSRGEAVEIGGGFRVPDVLNQSGAMLVDVGTTNRTYASDYERAIDPQTTMILKVHPSNFALSGFTAAPTMRELANVARNHSVILVEDLGSGALLDTSRFGLGKEPSIGERLAEGVNIVTASGDKLLGGPQAGIIAGSADMVERIERHPLARAVRVDKTCLAGMAATLRHYARGEAVAEVPVWRMIATSTESLRSRAERLLARLEEFREFLSLIETRATVGGGALPGEELPSLALVIAGQFGSSDSVARSLRLGEPPVFPRIEEQRVVLDMRTVLPEQDDRLGDALRSLFSAGPRN